MSPLILVTALLFRTSGIACEKHFVLTQLIDRVHEVSNSATIIFYGLEDEFLRYFIKMRPDIPLAIFHYNAKETENKEKCYWNALLVVQTSSQHNCESLHKRIPSLRIRNFVIISAESLETFHQCILFLRKKNFLRIFGIVKGVTYAYLQYADDPVRSFSITDSLPNSLSDLNGYKFRTIISPDLPRVFWFKDARGNRKIGGYIGRLFMNFLGKHNATLVEIYIKDIESRFMLAVTEATKNKEIDVSMNAYKPVNGLEMSYPICLMDWSIIAPINGHLDPNQYFVRPFGPIIWLLIGLTLSYIVLMNFLNDYLANKPARSVWQSFSKIYLTMLNQSAEIHVKRDFRFYGQVIVLAFILGNLYTVMLTSFLTVYIQIKQYNTIQDLIDNNFSVMMLDYEWKAIEDPELHPRGFEKIVTLVEREVMFRERNSMVNTSFAYAMGADKASFYIGFQKRFAIKSLFHMMQDTLGNYYLGFLLAEYSPFLEILNKFIIEIFETGLLEKWLLDTLEQVRTNGLLKIGMVFPERKTPYPLKVYHLRFAWICLGSGWIIASVVFVGERVVEMLRIRKLNRLANKNFVW